MMVRVLRLVVGAAVLINGTVALGVNCDQVKKYAATGRSEDDIAETMVVDVNEVKKCLRGDEKGKAGQPPAPADQKAAPPAEPKKE